MSDVIGFNNKEANQHRMTNSLDGKLELHFYVNKAAGITTVFVNGTPFLTKDAGEGCEPFDCGILSLPRGEIVLSVESGCDVSKILLTENENIDTPEKFALNYANRKGQFVFERTKPNYTPEMLELLKRHGFLYEQIGDCADGKMPSGIPLGGMGCGKIEICEDGMLTAFTGNNNQDSPIYRMPGSFLTLGSGNTVKILRNDTESLPYEPIAHVETDFVFPFAKLKAYDDELPITAEIEAFSPSVPGNVADSALPCAVFHVTLQNTSDDEADAMFCFSWENIINVGGSMEVPNGGTRIFPTCYHTWNGSFVWSDRTVNFCEKKLLDGRQPMLRFAASDDRKNPMSFGEHILWCSDENACCVSDRSILPEDEAAFAAWLAGRGAEPDTAAHSEFRAGSIVIRRKLSPGELYSADYILVWYMPTLLDEEGRNPGVEYTNRFADAEEVLRYVIREKDSLYCRTKELEDILTSSTLPAWFTRRLLDDRFVTVTCSWYDRDGNFSINEAPTGMGGCLGTLDQRTASQGYYTAFYPELDKRELDLFRRSQAEDGMCAHEIGFAGIKLVCRPFSKWPDLAASYIIQVYHTYQRTGDLDMLRLHMPHIRKAIDWTLTLDDKNCGIPYICAGRGTTYDNQFWEGISAFIATMQIASYRIGALCAQACGDSESASKWNGLAADAARTREKYLWNSEENYYYNAYNLDTDAVDTSCFICSLAGEWAAIRAGLEPVIPMEQIAAAATSITDNCIGQNGLTDQGGRRDTTDGFTQYPMAYLASPALYARNSEAAWKVAEITEKVITGPDSNHFNQSLTYNFDGKRHGLPYYMTAPSSWNMLEALNGLCADLPNRFLSLAPVREEGQAFRMPVFLPDAWFMVEIPEDGCTMTFKPLKTIGDCRFSTLKLRGSWKITGADCSVGCREENGYTIIETEFNPGKDTLVFTCID